MIKKGGYFSCLVVLFLSCFLLSSFVHAEIDLTINANLAGVNTDFKTITDDDASLGYDGFDLIYPTLPSNYSAFYSNVTGNFLSVDVWPLSSAPRNLSLVYNLNPQVSGTLALNWSFSDSTYNAILYDYGTSAAHASIINRVNMEDDSTYSVSSNGVRYFVLEFTNSSDEEEQGSIGQQENAGSSGGGGSGGSGTIEIVKPVLLHIINPGLLTVDKKDKIVVPIELSNDGEFILKGVLLFVSVTDNNKPTQEVKILLDKEDFGTLSPGESQNTTLTINVDSKEEKDYRINLYVSVDDPVYSETSSILLSIKEGKKIQDKFVFLGDLLSKNSECAEIKEISDEAKTLYENKQFTEAELKLNEAIDACQNLIFQRKLSGFLSSNKYSAIIFVLVGLIVLLSIVVYYYYRKQSYLR